MLQKLYIGNLPYRTTENDIRELFSKYKPIHSTMLISDRKTGLSRGFGFIELEEVNADAAITELGDTSFGGRVIRISKAKEREPDYFPDQESTNKQFENYQIIDPFI
ncbi:MAG: RNA-binding protein [Chitinispirillales bacterium]|jgi:RNA recognition motif-containing protein|nr:RNA-binding protein [Chitinispirillales bacterium]